MENYEEMNTVEAMEMSETAEPAEAPVEICASEPLESSSNGLPIVAAIAGAAIIGGAIVKVAPKAWNGAKKLAKKVFKKDKKEEKPADDVAKDENGNEVKVDYCEKEN